jgi:hypothetical protein
VGASVIFGLRYFDAGSGTHAIFSKLLTGKQAEDVEIDRDEVKKEEVARTEKRSGRK